MTPGPVSEGLFAAIELAARTHRGHYRKGSDLSHLVHPLNTACILIEHQVSGDAVVEAVWQRFHKTRVDQAWYYHGLVAAQEPRMVTEPALELFQALAREVKAVFGAPTTAGDRR